MQLNYLGALALVGVREVIAEAIAEAIERG